MHDTLSGIKDLIRDGWWLLMLIFIWVISYLVYRSYMVKSYSFLRRRKRKARKRRKWNAPG